MFLKNLTTWAKTPAYRACLSCLAQRQAYSPGLVLAHNKLITRGIRTSETRCRSGSLWSKVFPLLRNPDGSVNHMHVQQYVLIMFITFMIGDRVIKRQIAEHEANPEGETVKEEDEIKPATAAPEQIKETKP